MNETFAEFRDVLILILGAMIGVMCSLFMWYKQAKEERRRKRADILLTAIQLCLNTGTHTRCLLYSKAQGIKGILELPDNPVDHVMAIDCAALLQYRLASSSEVASPATRFVCPWNR